jgi:hypothetical protein
MLLLLLLLWFQSIVTIVAVATDPTTPINVVLVKSVTFYFGVVVAAATNSVLIMVTNTATASDDVVVAGVVVVVVVAVIYGRNVIALSFDVVTGGVVETTDVRFEIRHVLSRDWWYHCAQGEVVSLDIWSLFLQDSWIKTFSSFARIDRSFAPSTYFVADDQCLD